jgi:hypothetical protein
MRRMAHSFAYLRPTSTRAPSGPIDSSCGCPCATAKTSPGLYIVRCFVLRDDKGASENEPTDREGMPVLSLCWTRRQVLRFDFRVAVGSKVCLEVDLVHVISPSPSASTLYCATWPPQSSTGKHGCGPLPHTSPANLARRPPFLGGRRCSRRHLRIVETPFRTSDRPTGCIL